MAHAENHDGASGGLPRGPAIIAVAVLCYLVGMGLRPAPAESRDFQQAAGPGYYEPAPALGPADAPVVLTMVSDFRCPFCAMKMTLMKRLMQEHRDVRFVFKYLGAVRDPQDPNQPGQTTYSKSEAAAIAAMAANRQGAFWEFADQLFLNQKHRASWTRDNFIGYARTIGLDTDQFARDLDHPSLRSYIRKDAKAAEVLSVSATPQLFINGRLVSNHADAAQIRRVIREARDSVAALVARGHSVADARAIDAAEQHIAGERFAQLYINNDVLDLRVDLR